MTPQEINEAVARKLGWSGFHHAPMQEPAPKNFCGSIAAAWEIVEKLLSEDHAIRLYGRQGFTVNIDGWEETADTAPMAICLAFLKLEDK